MLWRCYIFIYTYTLYIFLAIFSLAPRISFHFVSLFFFSSKGDQRRRSLRAPKGAFSYDDINRKFFFIVFETLGSKNFSAASFIKLIKKKKIFEWTEFVIETAFFYPTWHLFISFGESPNNTEHCNNIAAILQCCRNIVARVTLMAFKYAAKCVVRWKIRKLRLSTWTE